MSYTEKLRDLEEQQLLPADSEESAFHKLLGYNIAAAREKKGILQKQVADLLGITQSAYSRIEVGETRLNIYYLPQVAKLLGRRIQDLIPA